MSSGKAGVRAGVVRRGLTDCEMCVVVVALPMYVYDLHVTFTCS